MNLQSLQSSNEQASRNKMASIMGVNPWIGVERVNITCEVTVVLSFDDMVVMKFTDRSW